jgi:hypothetical protein
MCRRCCARTARRRNAADCRAFARANQRRAEIASAAKKKIFLRISNGACERELSAFDRGLQLLVAQARPQIHETLREAVGDDALLFVSLFNTVEVDSSTENADAESVGQEASEVDLTEPRAPTAVGYAGCAGCALLYSATCAFLVRRVFGHIVLDRA